MESVGSEGRNLAAIAELLKPLLVAGPQADVESNVNSRKRTISVLDPWRLEKKHPDKIQEAIESLAARNAFLLAAVASMEVFTIE